ncbi:MAG: pilus assembly PilX N-terminal domain-containing protein [Colwellia sp.]|nr:pilus assembly PilX N-terminal domain-containing protein [Colwellia sp.]
MCHKLIPTSIKKNKQSGSALVIALFVITVMSLLGVALVKMIGSNAESIAYEVFGTRAYQAAQAGVQRKMAELFPLLPSSGVCLAGVDYDFSAIDGLDGCSALDVVCTTDATVAGITYYTITSTGQCRVAGILTSRSIELKARSL